MHTPAAYPEHYPLTSGRACLSKAVLSGSPSNRKTSQELLSEIGCPAKRLKIASYPRTLKRSRRIIDGRGWGTPQGKPPDP